LLRKASAEGAAGPGVDAEAFDGWAGFFGGSESGIPFDSAGLFEPCAQIEHAGRISAFAAYSVVCWLVAPK